MPIPGGALTFNQFLIVDEEPLLFHTGPRKLFPLVKEAVDSVIPAASLRHISFSHYEADECGSLNEWLAIAPESAPLCGALAAMISVDDVADRPARPLQDGEIVSLGRHSLQWIDTPHLPHGWECGFLMEQSTATLLEKLAAKNPGTLACMHGSTWTGNGAALLRELGKSLAG